MAPISPDDPQPASWRLSLTNGQTVVAVMAALGALFAGVAALAEAFVPVIEWACNVGVVVNLCAP